MKSSKQATRNGQVGVLPTMQVVGSRLRNPPYEFKLKACAKCHILQKYAQPLAHLTSRLIADRNLDTCQFIWGGSLSSSSSTGNHTTVLWFGQCVIHPNVEILWSRVDSNPSVESDHARTQPTHLYLFLLWQLSHQTTPKNVRTPLRDQWWPSQIM